jgi:hypothetical protein
VGFVAIVVVSIIVLVVATRIAGKRDAAKKALRQQPPGD